MRSPLRVALTLALTLAAAAGAAELVLRFGVGLGDPPLARLDPETEYELVPSASYRRFGNLVAINAYGMRAGDPALPRPADERRVLLIGDSVVYGTHDLDQDETVAAALGRRLAAETGCAALALPLAASSWGPVNQAAALARTGALGAEAAVVVASAHDLYDTPTPAPDILPYRLARPWGAIGDAAEIVADKLRQPALHRGLPPPEARAAASLAALDAMADSLAAEGIVPVIAYHPTLSERRGAAAAEREAFRGWAGGRGLRFVDLGAAVATGGGPDTDGDANDGMDNGAGYLDDIHPDALGAGRMADGLAAILAPGLPACGPAAAQAEGAGRARKRPGRTAARTAGQGPQGRGRRRGFAARPGEAKTADARPGRAKTGEAKTGGTMANGAMRRTDSPRLNETGAARTPELDASQPRDLLRADGRPPRRAAGKSTAYAERQTGQLGRGNP